MAAHSVIPRGEDTPESWLAGHARGEPGAFDRLFEHFEPSIQAYLARCGLSSSEREDLGQEIFLRLHRAAHRYQPSRPARVWVFTVVANCTRSHFRRRSVRQRHPASELLPPPATLPSAEELHRGRETAALLQEALHTLGLVQREVVLLSALQAMSVAEIAETLGLPPGTVKTHLHRGRLLLAKAMARAEMVAQREHG